MPRTPGKQPKAKPHRRLHITRPRNTPRGELPSREDVLEAMAAQPGLKGKRDLARVFGISGDLRTPFKLMLREMERDGLIARSRKTLRRAAELPSVAVLQIPADADPEAMTGWPVSWNEEDGERPNVTILSGSNARVVPAPGNRVLARIERSEGPAVAYIGRPMKIIDSPRRAQIGIVRIDGEAARLVPVDRKSKEMRIAAGDLGDARDGDLVELEVRTSGRLMIPQARVTAVIGNPRTEGAVSLIALHNLEIPYRFPEAVLREAESARKATIKGREDWRHLPFVTIDPPDAKDHDDAVLAEPDTDPNNPGGHIVRVAIADVAAYVLSGTDLDREAYLRGNSVYFPDRVVPMLPERISNDLCSLKQGENRPALAVTFVIDGKGRVKRHSFHRVMIRSAGKLSYAQAQAAVDGHPDDQTGPLLEPVLRPLWAAYRSLAVARDHRAPLALDLPERRIELDGKGLVQRVFVPERLEAHRLIEEMMIIANVCAAETLEKHRTPLLYRVHDSPGPEKLAALRDFLTSLELAFARIDAVRPSHFNAVLAHADARGQVEQVSEMVLRSQAQAEYGAENYGHFGLNLDRYAHFTSPIRRYADLIVHRALIRALGLGSDGMKPEDETRLQGIAQHISMTERRAMAAERETTGRLIAEYLSANLGAQFPGRISGVTKSGLFVRLDETGADGFVPASTLGADYYRYVEAQQAMIGERTGERFRIGDRVTVRLLEAAPVAGALRFEILSEGERVNPSGGRPRGKRATRRQAPKPRRKGR
ncbi:MAG TPA: ribonuclease R [Devosiaceae bacterium]